MDTTQAKASVSRQIADLDALINAKETFAARIGLIPFVTGALAAVVTLVVLQILVRL